MLRRLAAAATAAMVAVVVSVLAPLAAPAWACGCGAYSPVDGGSASVAGETALVRWAGDGAEDVYLSLTVASTADGGALLFPVPDAKAVVSAGPTGLFDRLATITAPRVEYRGDGDGGNKGAAAAPGPAVTVENRQQIGPLDVATLSSGDPDALSQWLADNGFTAKPALATAARPYTSQGWAFVAVRLRPEAGAGALDGTLDPLQIHFAAAEPVYPMRLSSMAAEDETVRVYTLAPHRLDLHTADPGMSAVWAGSVANYAAEPVLGGLLGDGTDYLTRFDGTVTPTAATDDFHFVPAGSDAPLIPVTVIDEGSPGGAGRTGAAVAIILVILVLSVAAMVVAVRRTRRRRQTPGPI